MRTATASWPSLRTPAASLAESPSSARSRRTCPSRHPPLARSASCITQALKTTPRTGWVNHGVDKPESIADHMYRMSLMAMVAAKSMPELDQNRCVKLALIHDLAEAIVGDITPHDPVTKRRRRRWNRKPWRRFERRWEMLSAERRWRRCGTSTRGCHAGGEAAQGANTERHCDECAFLTRRRHRNPDGSRPPHMHDLTVSRFCLISGP